MDEIKLNKCLNTLDSISKLELNWNDNGAAPFSNDLINKIKLFIKYLIEEPEILANFDNTIQLDFKINNKILNVIFSEDDTIAIINNNKIINYTFDNFYKALNYIKIFFYGEPKNTVLFTGAFNPPTIAHYQMINSVFENKKEQFDYVVFALSNDMFLKKKQDKTNDWYFSEHKRLNMILNMIAHNPKVLLFGIEQGYTYDVLNSVKNEFNCENVYFACGSDKLNEIEHWGHHKELLTEFNFYILIRGEDEYKKIVRKCNKIFKKTKYVIGKENPQYKDISATQVRRMIDNKEDYKELVEEHVFKYLKEVCK